MPEKTFVLGVGAQKAGTSWLADFLARSPDVAAGCLKEYHLFDALDLPSAAALRATMLTKAERSLSRLARGAGGSADAGALQRAVFYADPTAYYEYFAGLLSARRARAATDFTPAYAGLSAARFADIRDEFARRGVAVHVVFLLRDPVERIWSAERMYHRNHPEAATTETVEQRVRRTYALPFHAVRTRYQDTLATLDQVFAPEQVTLELYERLFSREALERICTRLGVTPAPADLARRVNSSPKTMELSPETAATIATHYRDTYAACAARFGVDTISTCWSHAALAG